MTLLEQILKVPEDDLQQWLDGLSAEERKQLWLELEAVKDVIVDMVNALPQVVGNYFIRFGLSLIRIGKDVMRLDDLEP